MMPVKFLKRQAFGRSGSRWTNTDEATSLGFFIVTVMSSTWVMRSRSFKQDNNILTNQSGTKGPLVPFEVEPTSQNRDSARCQHADSR